MQVLDTFDLSEKMADVLHQQDGLARALTQRIADLNLPADEEHVLFALLHAQASCREAALVEARRLTRQQ